MTSLTGAVTAAAATIMESEMDISLMRLHITRSAINQTGGGRSVREGQTETEEREKKKGKTAERKYIKRGIGWTAAA